MTYRPPTVIAAPTGAVDVVVPVQDCSWVKKNGYPCTLAAGPLGFCGHHVAAAADATGALLQGVAQ